MDMFKPLLDILKPGTRIYTPGATAELPTLSAALEAACDRCAGVQFISCLIPGINSFDYAALHPDTRLTTFLLPRPLRGSFEAGKVQVMPLSYGGIVRYLTRHADLDWAIAHCAPPDVKGRCSYGIVADFGPLVWPAARKRLAIVNTAMPALKGSPSLNLAEADVVIEIDQPLLIQEPATSAAGATAIAQKIAELVPNGAAVQAGIGGVPGAALGALAGHRDLTIRSGLVDDRIMALHEAGALAAHGDDRAGFAVGPRHFYDFLEDSRLVRFAPASETHDPGSLAREGNFTAINGALEVDLFGQCNLEWQQGKLVSGIGGAPEFMRGAALNPQGRSIIGLASTARKETVSRIVAQLHSPTVSIGRDLVDLVVTENGVADLLGRSVDERAASLMAIAAPAHRDRLAAQWRTLRQSL